MSERGDDFGELFIEGIKIVEILKKNCELWIFSDLGDYWFRGEENGVELIKRSILFNFLVVFVIYRVISNVCKKGNEGCFINSGFVVYEKKISIEKVFKRGLSMFGLLMKSFFIGRSL